MYAPLIDSLMAEKIISHANDFFKSENNKKSFLNLAQLITKDAQKARREGILALEEDMDGPEMQAQPFYCEGQRLLVDGRCAEEIDHILSTKILVQKDPDKQLLEYISKTGTLAIQEGTNPYIIGMLMRAFVPDEYEDIRNQIPVDN